MWHRGKCLGPLTNINIEDAIPFDEWNQLQGDFSFNEEEDVSDVEEEYEGEASPEEQELVEKPYTGPTITQLVAELREALKITDENFQADEAQQRIIEDKLEELTKRVSASGPPGRHEAVEAGLGPLIPKSWIWPLSMENERSLPEAIWEDSDPVLRMREIVLRDLNALTPGYAQVVPSPILAKIVGSVLISAANPRARSKMLESMVIDGMKVMRNICTGSESNRDALETCQLNPEDADFTELFCSLLKLDEEPPDHFVRYWSEALSKYISDEDKGAVNPKAPQNRKRMFASHGGILMLSQILSQYSEPSTLNPAVISLAEMASEKELCDQIIASGAVARLELILQNKKNERRCPQDKAPGEIKQSRGRLVLNAIYCIRNLCRSPEFYLKLEQSFIIKYLLAIAMRMKGVFTHMELIMSTLAVTTIGCVATVAQFLREGGVPMLFQIMEFYNDNLAVLRSCLVILGNVVQHGGDYGKSAILRANGEVVVKEIFKAFPVLGSEAKIIATDIDLPTVPPRPIFNAEYLT